RAPLIQVHVSKGLPASVRSEPLPAEIADHLASSRDRLGRLGMDVVYLRVATSTNDIAAALADSEHHEGAVVTADAQTAGRGRRGRRWFSPPGAGVYVSVLLAPARARDDPDRATSLLTLAAGVAVAEGIETSSGLHVDLKWPNDLFVGDRK